MRNSVERIQAIAAKDSNGIKKVPTKLINPRLKNSFRLEKDVTELIMV